MVVWHKLIISLLLCLAIGSLSGLFTQTSEGSWYASITKPSFNPPNWLFGPVWSVLYILMGVVLYVLWMHNAKLALIFFFTQLALNFIWSFLFFTLQSPLLAFIEMLVLLAMIVLTMIYTYPVSKTASYLLIPYIAWVSFATLLTLAIFLLNR
jgi:tryptophan-rich sensory protein